MNPFQLKEIQIKKAFIIVNNQFSMNVINSAIFIFCFVILVCIKHSAIQCQVLKNGTHSKSWDLFNSTERQKRKDLLICQRDKDETNLE